MDTGRFKPPQFDDDIKEIAMVMATGGDAVITAAVIRSKLQCAFLDGVIAAIKDRAREQGVNLEP